MTDVKYPKGRESGMRTIYQCGLNKLFSLEFQEGY